MEYHYKFLIPEMPREGDSKEQGFTDIQTNHGRRTVGVIGHSQSVRIDVSMDCQCHSPKHTIDSTHSFYFLVLESSIIDPSHLSNFHFTSYNFRI
ncbi:hypothetical protein KY290_005840 [Solanum tuberosum]|uniref:Uncharacterized protein n=1 Tax=Solanum tuberosum TaxID=4113 RepID=A0ABQ7WH54_SOLTU|nr:hypothetical protein KY285_005401 [Solanum tuberosum]KAH0779413.1 hypothetical protein KY290_005840 [Solanum tuberosum]